MRKPTPARGAKTEITCQCGKVRQVRTADVNRGWGLSCSKRCAAIRRQAEQAKARAEMQASICEYLLGTCKSETEAAVAFGITEDYVLEAVVAVGEIERCETCSWWCELHEMDGDFNCFDCVGGDE